MSEVKVTRERKKVKARTREGEQEIEIQIERTHHADGREDCKIIAPRILLKNKHKPIGE